MKKIYFSTIAFLFVVMSFAQSNLINYKALIKDANGNVVTNQTIPFSIVIIKTDPNTGSVVYSENHNITTDANGIIMLNIGAGTADFGTFENIDWSSDRHFLLTGTDLGAGPISFGTTEFKAVPYALSSGDKVFSLASNVISNTSGNNDTNDFVIGSTQLDHTKPQFENDNRLFFNKSKGAFRVGSTRDIGGAFPFDGSTWDDINVGEKSFASGYDTTASGEGSTAMGLLTTASGFTSTALGNQTTASGAISVAIGGSSIASGDESIAVGTLTTATGSNSMAMGIESQSSGTFSTAIGTQVQATGDQAVAIGAFSEANGFSSTAVGFAVNADTFGATAVGINNIGGGDLNNWVATDPVFEVGNGTFNVSSNALTILKNGIITAPSLDITEIVDDKALVTKEYVDSNTGPFSTTSNITSNTNGNIDTDDFVFGSTQLDHTKPEFEDDNRMFFDKSKGAFRVGGTANLTPLPLDNGTAWDDANVGEYSFGFGKNNIASGSGSIAFMRNSQATGGNSVAIGNNTRATGDFSYCIGTDSESSGVFSVAIGSQVTASGFTSTALGKVANASGDYSTAMGLWTQANATRSTALGYYNIGGGNPTSIIATDPLFEVGNGASASNRSNALTILKNGATTINGSTTAIETTASSTVPAIQGIKQHTGNVDAIGVLGENTVSDFYGIGVRGTAGWIGVQGLVTGTGSGGYTGVTGVSEGVNAGTNYGVFGSASNGSTNYAVYANGDMAYTGTLTNVSDRTLKTNIRTMDNALESIMQLKPSQYSFKESYQKSMNVSSRPQFGFIAQELQAVLPDLVSENTHTNMSKKEQPKTYLGVNYIGLIPILTAGIQEQQEKIETLEEKLTTQQQIIETLLARVEALENN